MKRPIICAHCGARSFKDTGGINRALRAGAPLFCSIKCSADRRKINKSSAQKIEEKRLYDIEYRVRNEAELKSARAAYYQRTKNPEREAAYRKANMARHVAYCQRPEYRAWKAEYDLQLRAKEYGPFAGVWLLLRDIDREVNSRASDYEVRVTNGTINKKLKRRREYEKLVSNKS